MDKWKLVIYMDITGPYETVYNSEAEALAGYERARRRAAFAKYQMEIMRAH